MPAVGLVYHPDHAGILCGIAVGDLAGAVAGAVVDDDDLHPVAAGEEGLDAAVHIAFGIVAWYRKGQVFHGVLHSLLQNSK